MFILAIYFLSIPTLEAGKIEIIREEGREFYLLKEGVTVKIDEKIVKSKEGMYIESEGEALLWDSVILSTPNYEVRADTLLYKEKEKEISFYGNVRVKDGKREIKAKELISRKDTVYLSREVTLISGNITISGGRGIYLLDQGYGIIIDSPVASIENAETLKIISREMAFRGDTFWGIKDVEFYGKNLKGKGDSLLYYKKEERGILLGRPKVIFEEGEAEADSILWILNEGVIKKIEFTGKAILITKSEEGILTIRAPFLRALTVNGSFTHLYGEDIEEGKYQEMKEDEGS